MHLVFQAGQLYCADAAPAGMQASLTGIMSACMYGIGKKMNRGFLNKKIDHFRRIARFGKQGAAWAPRWAAFSSPSSDCATFIWRLESRMEPAPLFISSSTVCGSENWKRNDWLPRKVDDRRFSISIFNSVCKLSSSPGLEAATGVENPAVVVEDAEIATKEEKLQQKSQETPTLNQKETVSTQL